MSTILTSNEDSYWYTYNLAIQVYRIHNGNNYSAMFSKKINKFNTLLFYIYSIIESYVRVDIPV